MPFPLISTALGVAFFLVWMFIGGMIFRDSRLTAKRECEFADPLAPSLGSLRRQKAA